MADDIVTRLRFHEHCDPECVTMEAADEIERLRAAGDALVAAIRTHDLTEQDIKAWEEARRG